jgi:hypothetical protein
MPGSLYVGAPNMPAMDDAGGGMGVPPSTPSGDPSILGAQAVRPTGSPQKFDQAYLQNLATSLGGLFSRPQGNLGFNPLGTLSDIPNQPMGFGNAPTPGLPSTMLQDALNGLGWALQQGPQGIGGGGGGGNFTGGGGGGGGGGGSPMNWLDQLKQSNDTNFNIPGLQMGMGLMT